MNTSIIATCLVPLKLLGIDLGRNDSIFFIKDESNLTLCGLPGPCIVDTLSENEYSTDKDSNLAAGERCSEEYRLGLSIQSDCSLCNILVDLL